MKTIPIMKIYLHTIILFLGIIAMWIDEYQPIVKAFDGTVNEVR